MPRYRLPSDPGASAFAITPSSTEDLVRQTRGIYVGGGGDLVVDMADSGEQIVFKAVPTGTTLPIQVRRVYAAGAGTTATFLVALF
jgi:hypothetical protein